MVGKIVIITGANSGLGYNNTIQFANKGATVIMACRNKQKGGNALSKVKSKVPGAKLELMLLDLGSFESVSTFVTEFKSKYQRLDVLLNNAGILFTKYTKTDDGLEGHLTGPQR